MTGNVNQHFMARYGSAMLMSMIGAGASTIGVNPNDEYNSLAMYRQGVATSFAQTARSELQQTAGIQNTIQPPQGTPITILVNRDISFEDVLTQGNHL
jgi:type IV secretion system protein VirB10